MPRLCKLTSKLVSRSHRLCPKVATSRPLGSGCTPLGRFTLRRKWIRDTERIKPDETNPQRCPEDEARSHGKLLWIGVQVRIAEYGKVGVILQPCRIDVIDRIIVAVFI